MADDLRQIVRLLRGRANSGHSKSSGKQEAGGIIRHMSSLAFASAATEKALNRN
jgi:hypothetical protein